MVKVLKHAEPPSGKIMKTRRERYSYIVLVLLCLFTGVANVGYTIHHSDETRHKFCEVMRTITENPIPKPANPKADPSREQLWELYTDFMRLKRSLGC